MSNNSKKSGRQTRNSSKQSTGGGSRPASPTQTKFTFSAPSITETTGQHESIWNQYRKNNPQTSDKQLKKALEAEQAMAMEDEIVQDTYGPSPKDTNVKGKMKENPEQVENSKSRDPITTQQKIANNLDGTNKTPVPNKEFNSTAKKDQQTSVDNPNLEKADQLADPGNQPMDVDPENSNKEKSSVMIEKGKEYVALVPYGELQGSKQAKTNKIKEALRTYNVQYNRQLPVIPLGKQGAKVTFSSQENFEKFLNMELILKEKKGEGESEEIIDIKLHPKSLKPEKAKPKEGDEDGSKKSENSNARTIQVIDIPAYRNVREIRESFEEVGEIEKIYTRGAGLYQVAFITYKSEDTVVYFNQQWSYHINKDVVRVLPLQLSQEDREKRKKFSLRLSGLYYQTSGYDLQEVVKQCKGRSCFIPAMMIRGKYQRCRYAYIHFTSEEEMNAARAMNIEFKKGNANARQLYWSEEKDRICNICGNPAHMAKDCDKKDVNKSNSKRFISGADNWKNLKKSYADAAKSKQKQASKGASSKSRDFTKKSNSSNSNQVEDDINQHPALVKFKEGIINQIRKLEEKMSKMESIMSNTDKQIHDVMNTQKALKCDKAHPVISTTKKGRNNDGDKKQQESQKKKRACRSDTESEEDEDAMAEKVSKQSQQLQNSDNQIQNILAQQQELKETHDETKSLLSAIIGMITGGSSASSFLGEDDEVLDDANLE